MKRYSQLIIIVTGTVALASATVWRFVDHAQNRTQMLITPTGQAKIALDAKRPSASQGQELALKARQDELAHDIQVLKRDLAQLTDRVTAAKEKSDTNMGATSENDNLPEPSLEELKAQEAATMAKIEDEFRAEPVDATQSFDSRNEIATSLQTKAFKGSTLVDIECRAVSCRIEARHEDKAAMETFIGDSPHLIPWDSDGMSQILDEGDGSLKTVSYFKRVSRI